MHHEAFLVRFHNYLHGILVLALLLPVTFGASLVLVVLRNREHRWAFAHRLVRIFAPVAGISLSSPPGEHDPGPVVYVANHSSITDALVLIGHFPQPVRFVAASEFAAKPFIGSLLRRMSVEFIHRDDPRKAAAEVRHLVDLLDDGARLVIFPEGSLSKMRGLRSFQPGAFYAATRASASVVPLAISGSDNVLAPYARLPRRGNISVRMGEAIMPTGKKRSDLLTLSKRARDAVLLLSGLDDLENQR